MRSVWSSGCLSALLVALAAASPPLSPPAENQGQGETAVVLWHGFGDTCCLPFSMGAVKKQIEKQLPGAYVNSLMIGSDESSDQKNGFFMPIADQLKLACKIVTEDPKLAAGFHAMGFSQGGLFVRALVQSCPEAKIRSVISIGGPQAGIYGFKCVDSEGFCGEVKKLLELGAYVPMVQNHCTPAQYWHDPFNTKKFEKDNVFLPKINNFLDEKNPEYKSRIESLDRMVLLKFLNDTVIVPRDSEWFGFYKEGQATEIEQMRESKLYTEDWIGIASLDKAGKLLLLECEGEHLRMPKGYFEEKIIPLLTPIPQTKYPAEESIDLKVS